MECLRPPASGKPHQRGESSLFFDFFGENLIRAEGEERDILDMSEQALKERLGALKQAASLHPLSVCCVELADQLVQELVLEVVSSSSAVPPPALQQLSEAESRLLEGSARGLPTAVPEPLRALLALEVQATGLHEQKMSEAQSVKGQDIFGHKLKQVVDTLTCTNCGAQVAANRFAPHLERCMLGKGRASARAARDQMRIGAEG